MEWFSQYKQDEYVAQYFHNKPNGVFLEVGALNGLEASNTLGLEKNLGWTGILVEAYSELFRQAVANRPKCKVFNIALYNRDGFVTFQKNYGYGLNLSGIPETYHPKHVAWIDSTDTTKKLVTVPCRTINTLLDKLQLYKIDYMSIDTEGSEYKIIEPLDTNRFDIELITVEVRSYIDYEEKIVKKMVEKGYNVLERLGDDLLFKKRR